MTHRRAVLKRDFQETKKRVARDIRLLGAQISFAEQKIKQQTIGLISEKEETGAAYEDRILSYLHGLDNLKKIYADPIGEVAYRVTTSVRDIRELKSNVKTAKYRAGIWVEFANSIKHLSARPSKKIAAVILDERDNMLAWDNNHLCYGIERLPFLFSKGVDGGRGLHVLCAEQNVPAKYLGLKAAMPASRDLKDIHRAVEDFRRQLAETAFDHPEFGKWTIASSHHPCIPCTEVLAPSSMRAFNEVITTHDPEIELKGPYRKTDEAAGVFREARLPVRLPANKHNHGASKVCNV